MAKEKNIIINIHNVADKKKKRRRRKNKKSKRNLVPAQQASFGAQATLYSTLQAHSQNQKDYNKDAKQYAENYVSQPPVLAIENGAHGPPRLAIENGPPRSASKAINIRPKFRKGKVLGDIDSNDALTKMSLVNIRILIKKKLKEVGVDVSDRELNKINTKNKLEKIQYYMNMYHEHNIEEVENFGDEGENQKVTSPNEDYTLRHIFEDQTVTSSPPFSFEDQTTTSTPIESFSPTKKPSGLRDLVSKSKPQFIQPNTPSIPPVEIQSAIIPDDVPIRKKGDKKRRKGEKKEHQENIEPAHAYNESVVDEPIDQTVTVAPVYESTRSTRSKINYAEMASKGLKEAKKKKEKFDKSKEITNQGNYAVMGSPSELNLPTSATKKNPLPKEDMDRQLIKDLRKYGMSREQQSNFFGERDG
jgi:hypothetical protein